MTFDRSLFAPAFAAVGMWIPIRLTSQDTVPDITNGFARYRRPDVVKVGGALSAEHEIGFEAIAFPLMREGDRIDFLDSAGGDPINGRAFRVRAPPFVTDDPAEDRSGYFKVAMLTKLAA